MNAARRCRLSLSERSIGELLANPTGSEPVALCLRTPRWSCRFVNIGCELGSTDAVPIDNMPDAEAAQPKRYTACMKRIAEPAVLG